MRSRLTCWSAPASDSSTYPGPVNRDGPGPRPGTTRMFAGVVPGMAALVTSELERLPGVHVTGAGFDGRSDLILFDVDRGGREGLWSLRTIEDLFVETGRTDRSAGDS